MITRLTLAALAMSSICLATTYRKEKKKNKELQRQLDILIDEKRAHTWVKVRR